MNVAPCGYYCSPRALCADPADEKLRIRGILVSFRDTMTILRNVPTIPHARFGMSPGSSLRMESKNLSCLAERDKLDSIDSSYMQAR